MITKLSLSNFKLHDKTELNLSGLTILTGMNGMGKSSIIQVLMLLRQSFLTNDLDEGLNLKGDLCNVGTSGELSCLASDESSLDISLDLDCSNELKYSFEYPDDIFSTLLTGNDNNVTDKKELQKYSLFNSNFQYISAFRFGPQKLYERDSTVVVNKRQISKVMGQCEYVIHYLSHYGDNEISLKEFTIDETIDQTRDHRLIIQTERWLRRISPNIKIAIEPIEDDFKLKYSFFRDENQITDKISALNTGFGITYVLPIIVAILDSKKDSLIFIENPEAHLHPSGQAELMKLIAIAVAQGVQIIIETHSDHIINGALVAINTGKMSSESVSVYYFDRDEHKHVCIPYHLPVTTNGQLLNPPKGFFDQIDIDLKILAGF